MTPTLPLRHRRGVASFGLVLLVTAYLAGAHVLAPDLSGQEQAEADSTTTPPPDQAAQAEPSKAAAPVIARPIRLHAPVAAPTPPEPLPPEQPGQGFAPPQPDAPAPQETRYRTQQDGDTTLADIRVPDAATVTRGWMRSGLVMLKVTGEPSLFVVDGEDRVMRLDARTGALLSGLHYTVSLSQRDASMITLSLRQLGIDETPTRVEAVFTQLGLRRILTLQDRLLSPDLAPGAIGKAVLSLCPAGGGIGAFSPAGDCLSPD